MFALSIYIATVLVLAGIRKYMESNWSRCMNTVKLTNKVAIVTGANSGIGYEITRNLAKREAEVVLACRNVQAAKEAIGKIKQQFPSAMLVPMELDLASIKSINNFVEEICAKYDSIDLLINNAGVSYPSKYNLKTKDGFEIHMGVNHLGHFYLTKRLLNKLNSTPYSRIVIITSKLHEKGVLRNEHLDNDLFFEPTDDMNFYANSKLANAYFCKELAKRTDVKVYSCCPGWVYTNLFRHHQFSLCKYLLIIPVAFLFMRSAEQGAQTPIYCATEPTLYSESGHMYRDCRKYQSKVEFDDPISQRLWEVSDKLINDKLKSLDQ